MRDPLTLGESYISLQKCVYIYNYIETNEGRKWRREAIFNL